MVTKTCTRCGVEQNVETGFYALSGGRGRQSWCKRCCQEHQRSYRQRTRERQLEYGRRNARRKRLRTYGLTEETYAALLESQGHSCAICGQPETTAKNLAVDHDHATGAVRGLLCFYCNTAIGKLRDDPALLRLAAEYLERSAVSS